MTTFVELEKQVQKNAVLERRIADLEAENARLTDALAEWKSCAICHSHSKRRVAS